MSPKSNIETKSPRTMIKIHHKNEVDSSRNIPVITGPLATGPLTSGPLTTGLSEMKTDSN